MTLRLVSEARPIPQDRLSSFEQKKLKEADAWIEAVIEDAKQPKPAADEIDGHKSGRVLFINGERGAGKTSLMLTLLEHWRGKKRKSDLRVLLPILDFDPLPRGMPLHGWLLEPWRNMARILEKDTGPGVEGKDLTEMWAEVFERVILGWSQVTVEGKGVVEKALAYQEQASGWVDTRKHWYSLVNAAICRSCRCSSKDCKAEHPFVFVVAIDDVDLQVEQVPLLLHAIRLLHHPNVVYVLTGHLEHLKFVLELDYIRQHGNSHCAVEQWPDQGVLKSRQLSERIKSYSRTLRDALLEKALPSHARLDLPTMSFGAVLNMHVGGDGETLKVADVLGAPWDEIASPMEDLGIVTARRAQHAIDNHLHGSSSADDCAAINFVADICWTSADNRGRVMLRGRLTTLLGQVFQAWEGDRLSIQLRDQPRFAFQPQFEEADSREGEEANRAAVVLLAVDEELIKAPNLVWRPDAGIVTTETRWESEIFGIDGIALFHWPWLERPTVREVLKLGALAEEMKSGSGEASDRDNLNEELILVWLRQNISWSKGVLLSSSATLTQICVELRALCNNNASSVKDEAVRWAREVVVMSAPYFGLPDVVASDLRARVCQVLAPNGEDIRKEICEVERRMVGDAIFAWRLNTARDLGMAFESKDGPSSPQFDKAVMDFLEKREKMSPESSWWAWRKESAGKGDQVSATTS